MKIPEILQVETPHSPGALASVLNVIAAAGLPDPLEPSIHERICRAVQAVLAGTRLEAAKKSGGTGSAEP